MIKQHLLVNNPLKLSGPGEFAWRHYQPPIQRRGSRDSHSVTEGSRDNSSFDFIIVGWRALTVWKRLIEISSIGFIAHRMKGFRVFIYEADSSDSGAIFPVELNMIFLMITLMLLFTADIGLCSSSPMIRLTQSSNLQSTMRGGKGFCSRFVRLF